MSLEYLKQQEESISLQMKKLAAEKNTLLASITKEEQQQKVENLKEIWDKKYKLEKDIEKSEKHVDSLKEEISLKRKELQQLEKEECPIIGHKWDYDWERHEQGGGLEEHCVVCGHWRDD